MSALELIDVNKLFGNIHVLKDVNIEVEDGEFVVFVGPSGCGKSTLLRVIAGLEDASSGEVKIHNEPVNTISPAKRGIAMVFQSYALYPHLNVKGNMSLALKQEKQSKKLIEQRIEKASEMLNLNNYLDRYPSELSGGQRQRVAIGRAIVREPKLFLFDEPLSNLDAALRMNTRLEIAKLHRQLGTCMIYVTHDQTEAMTLADKIVVLRDGCVEQIGSPIELYNNPVNQFVAGFLGSPAMNFFPAALVHQDDPRVMGVRPEDWQVERDSALELEIDHVENLGADTHLIGSLGDSQITVRLFGQNPFKVGEKVPLSVATQKQYFFDEAGKRA